MGGKTLQTRVARSFLILLCAFGVLAPATPPGRRRSELEEEFRTSVMVGQNDAAWKAAMALFNESYSVLGRLEALQLLTELSMHRQAKPSESRVLSLLLDKAIAGYQEELRNDRYLRRDAKMRATTEMQIATVSQMIAALCRYSSDDKWHRRCLEKAARYASNYTFPSLYGAIGREEVLQTRRDVVNMLLDDLCMQHMRDEALDVLYVQWEFLHGPLELPEGVAHEKECFLKALSLVSLGRAYHKRQLFPDAAKCYRDAWMEFESLARRTPVDAGQVVGEARSEAFRYYRSRGNHGFWATGMAYCPMEDTRTDEDAKACILSLAADYFGAIGARDVRKAVEFSIGSDDRRDAIVAISQALRRESGEVVAKRELVDIPKITAHTVRVSASWLVTFRGKANASREVRIPVKLVKTGEGWKVDLRREAKPPTAATKSAAKGTAPIAPRMLFIPTRSPGSLVPVCFMSDPATLTTDQQLIVACHRLDVSRVAELLREGTDVSARFERKRWAGMLEDPWSPGAVHVASLTWTPLLALANSSKFPPPPRDAWAELRDADVREQELAKTPSEAIAERTTRRRDIFRLLYSNDCPLDESDDFGGTPLMNAISNGHHGLARLLAESGAELNTKTKAYTDEQTNGMTPLHAACESEELTKLLLSLGADWRVTNSLGQSPPQWALTRGTKEVRCLYGLPAETPLWAERRLSTAQKEDLLRKVGLHLKAQDWYKGE